MYHYEETLQSNKHTMMKQRKGLTVRAKENLKLSHGGSSHSQVNPPIKAFIQSRHFGLSVIFLTLKAPPITCSRRQLQILPLFQK